MKQTENLLRSFEYSFPAHSRTAYCVWDNIVEKTNILIAYCDVIDTFNKLLCLPTKSTQKLLIYFQCEEMESIRFYLSQFCQWIALFATNTHTQKLNSMANFNVTMNRKLAIILFTTRSIYRYHFNRVEFGIFLLSLILFCVFFFIFLIEWRKWITIQPNVYEWKKWKKPFYLFIYFVRTFCAYFFHIRFLKKTTPLCASAVRGSVLIHAPHQNIL